MISSNEWIDIVVDPKAIRSTMRVKMEPDPICEINICGMDALDIVETVLDNYNIYAVNGICYNQTSPLKNSGMVSNKIVKAVKQIKRGEDIILSLGNLDAKREWGHAKDYAYAMWASLQINKADDYVIATGVAYTVREFVTKTFAKVGIDIEWKNSGINEIGVDKKTGKTLVKVDPKLLRPYDGRVLYGDAKKFVSATGFKFDYDFNKLLDALLEGND